MARQSTGSIIILLSGWLLDWTAISVTKREHWKKCVRLSAWKKICHLNEVFSKISFIPPGHHFWRPPVLMPSWLFTTSRSCWQDYEGLRWFYFHVILLKYLREIRMPVLVQFRLCLSNTPSEDNSSSAFKAQHMLVFSSGLDLRFICYYSYIFSARF